VGKKLKAAGHPYGQTAGHTFGDAPGWWYPYLWSWGGKEVAEDGKTVASIVSFHNGTANLTASIVSSLSITGGPVGSGRKRTAIYIRAQKPTERPYFRSDTQTAQASQRVQRHYGTGPGRTGDPGVPDEASRIAPKPRPVTILEIDAAQAG